MRKTPIVRKRCAVTDKPSFPDELAARIALARQVPNPAKRSYRCTHCGQWHLTGMDKK